MEKRTQEIVDNILSFVLNSEIMEEIIFMQNEHRRKLNKNEDLFQDEEIFTVVFKQFHRKPQPQLIAFYDDPDST